MPESFDILTTIKSVYPSIQRDFRRSFPKADVQEVDNLIGRFFWDTMMRPEKNTDPQAREKFLGNLAQSSHIPADWKADNLTFVRNVTQEAFRFTPKATYAQQEPLAPLLEKFAGPAREAREAALLKASESYEIKGTREEVLHQAKIARLEKLSPRERIAKELSGAAEVLRNVFGQHMVAPVAAMAAQAGVPGVESVAIAATPRVHFATEIEKKYGSWAVIPYVIAEAGIGFIIPGAGFARGLGMASRIPGVAGRTAKFVLTYPTLQNAIFLGGYSGSAYTAQKRQMGEKPTIGEFLIHSGAGTAIGMFMPHVGKVFQNVAVKKEFAEQIEMLLGKKIAKLRRMPEPKLRELIRESHLPKSVREPAGATQERLDWIAEQSKLPENLVVKRIKGLSRKGAVAQFLGQSLRAGAVGGGVQIGQDIALGLPVNLQNIAHNAAMMMGFHASGLISHVPRALRPPNGVADLSTPAGKGIVGKSIKFLLSSSDMSPEQAQAKFVENLTKNKVDAIRTADGEILKPKEIFAELNKTTEPGSQSLFDHLAVAYREYAKAMVVVPQAELSGGLNRLEVRTVMRSRIDNLVASVGRRLGESTDIPSTANDFKVTALRRNEDRYDAKLKEITEEFGQEGIDVVTESLRSGIPLSKMEVPVARDIMNRHPMMRSVIDNFREAMSKPVSEKETQQRVMEFRAQEEGREKKLVSEEPLPSKIESKKIRFRAREEFEVEFNRMFEARSGENWKESLSWVKSVLDSRKSLANIRDKVYGGKVPEDVYRKMRQAQRGLRTYLRRYPEEGKISIDDGLEFRNILLGGLKPKKLAAKEKKATIKREQIERDIARTMETPDVESIEQAKEFLGDKNLYESAGFIVQYLGETPEMGKKFNIFKIGKPFDSAEPIVIARVSGKELTVGTTIDEAAARKLGIELPPEIAKAVGEVRQIKKGAADEAFAKYMVEQEAAKKPPKVAKELPKTIEELPDFLEKRGFEGIAVVKETSEAIVMGKDFQEARFQAEVSDSFAEYVGYGGKWEQDAVIKTLSKQIYDAQKMEPPDWKSVAEFERMAQQRLLDIVSGKSPIATRLSEVKPPVKTSEPKKPSAEPLQPVWEPEASFAQRQTIGNLRERMKVPSHYKKLKGAIDAAKEAFKGTRGEMRPEEIAEADRLFRIEKGKKEQVKPRKPIKEKSDPEEISRKVEELDAVLSSGEIEVAEKLHRDIRNILGRKPFDERTKAVKQVLDRFGEIVERLSKEVESAEIQSFLTREHQKVGSAVEHLGETGVIAKGLKDGEYVVYFPTEDVATRVHWTEAQPSNLKEAVKLSASFDRFRKAGKEVGMTDAEIETFIDAVEGNGRLGVVIGIDPSELARLAGKAASKVKELFKRKPSSVGDLASSVELYRHRTYLRRYGSILARFFQFAVFGDPMKEITRKQVRDVESAIEQNKDNPFMGAEPHLIDPTDFMVKVLGRTNWSRLMAKESGQEYQPMNRIDGQRLLKEFAKISVAIRDKNFALASNFGLPLAISESTPRTRKAFEGMTIATSKRDARMADVYEIVNDINVVADRKARKFINPKTGNNINREVADLLQGFVKWNDPNLMHESREIANLFRKSRFREKFWDILNNVHNFRTLPKMRGLLMKDRVKFIDFWVERGLNSKKVTPENAEATRLKLESEAGRIFDNLDKRKEIIDDIIEENKLGKIVSKQGMSLYYPGYAKKLSEFLREKAQKLEEGGYVKGGYGGIVFEHARKLTLEERKAHPELYKEPNVVDDFLTYGLDVLSLAYRADMDFIMWRAAKEIKLDMGAAPQYARRFAHDLEFIESLRDRVLTPPRNIGRRISGNIAALTSAAILPGLRTVFRNLIGGTGMTYVWSGSKAMAGAWGAIRSGKYRGYSVPKIVKMLGAEHQELIEGGIAKVKTKPTEVMPRGFSEEMSQWAARWTQYSLTRVMPLVPDVWPWFAQVTKRMTFAGSEGLLRPTAGMAGFISTYEAVLSEGAKYRRSVRIFGNSVVELALKAKKKHGETISNDFIQSRMKATKSPKAQNKYALDLNVRENDKQLNQRAFREALKGARETIMWTQFLYGAINTPKLMAHPLGRVILVLRKYTWNKAMVGLRVMRELPPSKGGGSEEWARFMRYVGVVGISTALSKALHIGIGRYFADDFLEMLGSVKAMMEGVDPDEAFWGKSWKIWLAGAAVGRNMDILAHSQGDRAGPEMNKYLEVVLANAPYGKPIIDAWREYVKVTERGKNVFEALANNLIGLMREYKR